MLARRYGFPIYATQGTIDQMKGMSSLGAIDGGLYHTIRPDETFSIGDVEVEPFHIFTMRRIRWHTGLRATEKVPQLPQTWESIMIT